MTPDDAEIEAQFRMLGIRLKWARVLVEPNRSDFAKSLGVDVSTIRNIENGTRGPSVQLLMAICHSLRISFEYLLQGDLRGVDGELAALLAEQHPELRPPTDPIRGRPGKATPSNSVRGSKTQLMVAGGR